MKKAFLLVFSLLIISAVNADTLTTSLSEESTATCAIYFTKIGCPNCSVTDPAVLGEWPEKNQDLVVIEYVFTSWYEENANLMGEYNLEYGTGGGVPLIIIDEQRFYSGRIEVFDAEAILEGMESNDCLLLEGQKAFSEINLNDLPAKPKIWKGNRHLENIGEGNVPNEFLKELLFTTDLYKTLANSEVELQEVKAEPAPISGGGIEFTQAIRIDDSWILKLKEKIDLPENVRPIEQGNGNEQEPTGNPFLLPTVLFFICLAALIIFVKVKKSG